MSCCALSQSLDQGPTDVLQLKVFFQLIFKTLSWLLLLSKYALVEDCGAELLERASLFVSIGNSFVVSNKSSSNT